MRKTKSAKSVKKQIPRYVAIDERGIGARVKAVTSSITPKAMKDCIDDLLGSKAKDLEYRFAGIQAMRLLAFVCRCHYSSSPKMTARINHLERAGEMLSEEIDAAAAELEQMGDAFDAGSHERAKLHNVARNLRQAAYDVDDAARLVTACVREECDAKEKNEKSR